MHSVFYCKEYNSFLYVFQFFVHIEDVFQRKKKHLVSFITLFLSLPRELPSELEGTFDKEEVDVKVEDKKHEMCVSTKPVFQPFSGPGHRLGR